MPNLAFSKFKRALGSRAESAEAWCAIGAGGAILGDLDYSRKAFEQALNLRPDYWWAHYCLGVVLSDAGEGSLAEREIERAFEGLPGDARVARALGAIRVARGDSSGAAGLLEAALARCQAGGEAAALHLDLSRVYRLLGRDDEARQQLEQAVRLRPADARLLLNLGAIYLAAGDSEGAAAQFEKALELSPGLVSALMKRTLGAEGER